MKTKPNMYLLAWFITLFPAIGIAQESNIFDIYGVRYQEITPIASYPREVRVCSPNAPGREYTFPVSENGSIDIPSEINHDGIVFAVTEIEDGTFLADTRLIDVTLPPSIHHIGGSNFSECSNLVKLDLSAVTLSSSLPLIDCPALRILKLPESQLTDLYDSFIGQYELDELWLPNILGENTVFLSCFLGAKSIRTVYSLSEVPPFFDSGIDGSPNEDYPEYYYHLFGNHNIWDNQPIIYVPKGCVTAYNTSISWGWFSNIREYETATIECVSIKHDKGSDFSVVNAEIISADGSHADVFDLLGRQVPNRNLQSGVYIARWGAITRKVAVSY